MPFKVHIFLYDVSRVISLLYLLDEIRFSFLNVLINDSLAMKISQPKSLSFGIAKKL